MTSMTKSNSTQTNYQYLQYLKSHITIAVRKGGGEVVVGGRGVGVLEVFHY